MMQSVGEVTTMFPIAGGFIEVSLLCNHVKNSNDIDRDFLCLARRPLRRPRPLLRNVLALLPNVVSLPRLRMERRRNDPAILGASRKHATLGLDTSLPRSIQHNDNRRSWDLRRDRVLAWMVQTHLLGSMLLHLLPGQCRSFWKWIYWI